MVMLIEKCGRGNPTVLIIVATNSTRLGVHRKYNDNYYYVLILDTFVDNAYKVIWGRCIVNQLHCREMSGINLRFILNGVTI